MSRTSRFVCAAALVSTAAAAEAVAQTYDYGAGSTSVGDSGFMVLLEGGLANPRNTDNVVATRIGPVTTPIITTWDDDFAGRIGLGYQWASGNQIFGQAWGFSTETAEAGTGSFDFGIGPPIAPGFGDQGTAFDIGTEIEATTADVGFGRRAPLGERFEIQGSVGVRYAHYEEVSGGTFADGATIFAAAKSVDGEMIGVRGGIGASWQWKQLVLQGAGALSLLDGEVTGDSALSVIQGGGGAAAFSVTDDGRSGSIWELELLGGWRSSSGSIFIGAGWEQQVWDGITSDLTRSVVSGAERDSIAISGYKARISFIF